MLYIQKLYNIVVLSCINLFLPFLNIIKIYSLVITHFICYYIILQVSNTWLFSRSRWILSQRKNPGHPLRPSIWVLISTHITYEKAANLRASFVWWFLDSANNSIIFFVHKHFIWMKNIPLENFQYILFLI